MYEHGEGLPKDFHLAKRYYDEAVEMNPSAALPVYLALTGLWLRQNFQDNILVSLLLIEKDLIILHEAYWKHPSICLK
jgi:SEL1 protein